MKNIDNVTGIIDRIKRRRMELGLSYQELADRTGLSKSTLQRYETGDIANIPLSKIEMLANGLQTTPEYIMGWDEKPLNTETDDEPIIIRRLRNVTDKMDEKQQEKMMNILKASFEDLFDEEDN